MQTIERELYTLQNNCNKFTPLDKCIELLNSNSACTKDVYFLKQGIQLYNEGLVYRSIDCLQLSILLNPCPESKCILAFLFITVNAFDQAIRILDGLTNNAYAHYILGVAYKAKGRLEKAISNFKLALNLHPACHAVKKYLNDAYELLDKQNGSYLAE